jgi:Flp pilus assembly protein TadG
MNWRKNLIANEDGGPLAEFALVLPIALLFLFGIIDVGRYMWEVNSAEKATQMGARFAAVGDVVASDLPSYNFTTQCSVAGGNVVTAAQFPGMTCTGGGTVASPTATCTAASSTCGTQPGTTASAPALGNIVNRMRVFNKEIVPANVTVTYTHTGLGYAGNPNGLDVTPLVTVTIQNLAFKPLTTRIFRTLSIPLPDFSYSLTLEDGAGSVSN